MYTPRELDLRSLRLHQLVAQKIRADPALFSVVRETVERQLTNSMPSVSIYLLQWLDILDRGIEEALAVAVEDTERGQVLRSASPFAGVLTEDERRAFLHACSTAGGKQP